MAGRCSEPTASRTRSIVSRSRCRSGRSPWRTRPAIPAIRNSPQEKTAAAICGMSLRPQFVRSTQVSCNAGAHGKGGTAGCGRSIVSCMHAPLSDLAGPPTCMSAQHHLRRRHGSWKNSVMSRPPSSGPASQDCPPRCIWPRQTSMWRCWRPRRSAGARRDAGSVRWCVFETGDEAILRHYGSERGQRIVDAVVTGPDLVFELVARRGVECGGCIRA